MQKKDIPVPEKTEPNIQKELRSHIAQSLNKPKPFDVSEIPDFQEFEPVPNKAKEREGNLLLLPCLNPPVKTIEAEKAFKTTYR